MLKGKNIKIETFLLFSSTTVFLLVSRIYSIWFKLSFWNDESNVALFAKSITQNNFPQTTVGWSAGFYQILLYYISFFSFKIFGVNEFAGRIPSVITGTILVFLIYWITLKMSNSKSALIAAFLGGFLQIQLAWSTQLRPYIWLQLLTVCVVYFSYKFLKHKGEVLSIDIVIASIFALLASLFHGTGLINLVIISFAIVYKSLMNRQYKYLLLSLVLIGLGCLIIVFSFSPSLERLLTILFKFEYDPLHYRIFLTHNYLWLLAGSALGTFALWKSDKKLFFLMSFSVVMIFAIAMFKLHPRYIRYSLPAFPLLYILFGIGIVWAIERVEKYIPLKHNSLIASILVLGIFFAFPLYKEKIILFPQKYYSINADMRENPIVDYKGAFAKIEKLMEGQKDVIVMDAWNDRVPWYLPGQKYIWLVKDGNGKIDQVYGEQMVGTIEGFELVKSEYESGIVIVENWQSLTPPELQNHVKEMLKFEFTQDTVEGNEKDPWSISVYSWGLK